LYCFMFTGLSSVVILCAVTSVWPNGSSGNRNKLSYLLIILFDYVMYFLFVEVIQMQKFVYGAASRARNVIRCDHVDRAEVYPFNAALRFRRTVRDSF